MNFVLLSVAVSFVFGGVSYISTQNLILSICVFLLSSMFLILYVRRELNKFNTKTHRYHQCYQFINSYLISLSIKGSMSAALESGYEISDEGTKEIIDSIKELSEEEKLQYLDKYFKFDLYHLFVDTVLLWNEEGGDILEMSQYLVNKARLKEEYLINCKSIHRSKLVEFAVLWAITLAILCVLRFALSQFFSRISQTIIYQAAVGSLFAFIIFSIYMLLKHITNIELEGWREDEKQT